MIQRMIQRMIVWVGIDATHVIIPNTPVDFIIHFQNTGTDTSYKVVVADTLSDDFDFLSLHVGAASHSWKASNSGQGLPILNFTFDHINLVDSLTDELNSHAFVKYKITPKNNTPR